MLKTFNFFYQDGTRGKCTQTKTEHGAISQNYQRFWKKKYNYLEANCLRDCKMALKIVVDSLVLE